MKYELSTWMTAERIAAAIKRLEYQTGSFNKNTRDAAAEGIVCLNGAQPGYLMNLIPQDHPDRIVAVRLLNDE